MVAVVAVILQLVIAGLLSRPKIVERMNVLDMASSWKSRLPHSRRAEEAHAGARHCKENPIATRLPAKKGWLLTSSLHCLQTEFRGIAARGAGRTAVTPVRRGLDSDWHHEHVGMLAGVATLDRTLCSKGGPRDPASRI